jgi:hypothetical protein
MKPVSNRLLLYTKDIEKITGKSARTSRRIAQRIKKKHAASFVTLDAFCEYTGIKEEKLNEYFCKNG